VWGRSFRPVTRIVTTAGMTRSSIGAKDPLRLQHWCGDCRPHAWFGRLSERGSRRQHLYEEEQEKEDRGNAPFLTRGFDFA
jgi:hypothetical protein